MIRDFSDEVIAAMSGNQPMLVSPLYAEVCAMLEGLQLAKRMRFKVLNLYYDSLRLVSMLNGEENREVKVQSQLWNIEEVKSSFQEVKFLYTNRTRNGIAHQLAKLGLRYYPKLWLQKFPPWLLNLAQSENHSLYPVGELFRSNESSSSVSKKKKKILDLFKFYN